LVVEIEKALQLENSILVDVRTEKEYNEDHIKNAINLPLFHTDEHKDIGTIYKMVGQKEAIEKGFDYVSPKLKEMYLEFGRLASEYDNIIIYCARGGMRSGSLVNLISSIGINAYQLKGGYKSYRNYVLDYLKTAMEDKKFVSVHGLTGAGKTDLLIDLEKRGIDVVDLEGIAKNSGSIFGVIAFDELPPTQKHFETQLFNKIYFSKERYIFIESESRQVGRCNIPKEIFIAMTDESLHILLETSVSARVERLCRDYIYSKNEENMDALKECIVRFRKRLSNKVVDEYLELLDNRKYEELVERYLVEYYDPLYEYSIDKYEYDLVADLEDGVTAIDSVIDYYRECTRVDWRDVRNEFTK
jgi:tRNA 2-selenouridine synthase